MSTITLDAAHVGAAPHRRRNRWLATGVLIFAGVMAVTYASWRRSGIAAGDRLARFQALYAERCDGISYGPEAAALARKLYLRSSTLQRTIDEQLGALEGGAACADVYRALRGVDFPLPADPPAERTATIPLPSGP